MTIQLAYRQLLAQLYEVYDDREAKNIADLVIENLTGHRKIDRIVNKDLPVTDDQQATLANYTKQLLQHRPVQYVLHEAWFANMKLYVDEHVLIPRPETEELVEWIVKDIKSQQRDDKLCILDIGTGSGCIPVALKKQLPQYFACAIDVSDEALHVAKKNALEQRVNIDFLQMNFLHKINWTALPMFDVITSNPPYIKTSEQAAMAANVLQYEPHIALFVPDNDSLVFYTAIAEFGQQHLVAKGSIYVEINETLGPEVAEIFRNQGFGNVEIRNDLQGKARMIKANRDV